MAFHWGGEAVVRQEGGESGTGGRRTSGSSVAGLGPILRRGEFGGRSGLPLSAAGFPAGSALCSHSRAAHRRPLPLFSYKVVQGLNKRLRLCAYLKHGLLINGIFKTRIINILMADMYLFGNVHLMNFPLI